jgi:DNA-directed RNA polymerase subunit RPC12/RpoP
MPFQSFGELAGGKNYSKQSPDIAVKKTRCAECGAKVDRLPFVSDLKHYNPIYCSKCYHKRKGFSNS